MVQHLRFFLSLASQTFLILDHLRFRRICCASDSLCIPGTLAWSVLDFHWPPFHQIHLLWVLCCRLRSVLSGCSRARLIGASLMFFGALTFIARFLDSLLIWGDHLPWERSTALQTFWSGNSCLGQGGFLNLFVKFLL